ncbi:MAG: hypothetical protein AAF368_00175 [Planctomycetota bacterium]
MGKMTDVTVAIDELDLAMDNPRLPRTAESREEALEALVRDDAVIDVAESIAQRGGLNPLERLGVYLDKDAGRPSYIALEGNRRVAALMLLSDPDILPKSVPQRSAILDRLRVAGASIDFDTVPAVLFEEPVDASEWVDLLHLPLSKAPAGRKRWDPQQQTRRGSGRNTEALRLLDFIVEQKFATSREMQRKITTLDRLVQTDERCRLIGVSKSQGQLKRVLPWRVFQVGLSKIVEDIVTGRLNSRSLNNKDELNAYAQMIFELMGSPRSENYVEPRDLKPSKAEKAEGQGPNQTQADRSTNTSSTGNGTGSSSPPGPSDNAPEDDETHHEEPDGDGDSGASSRTKVFEDPKVKKALKKRGFEKFLALYQSVTTISAESHPMLVVIGIQSLLDSLTRAAKPKATGKLATRIMGVDSVKALSLGPEASALSSIIQNIDTYANLSKHHERGVFRSGRQLVADMPLLTPIIVALAAETAKMWIEDD